MITEKMLWNYLSIILVYLIKLIILLLLFNQNTQTTEFFLQFSTFLCYNEIWRRSKKNLLQLKHFMLYQ